MKWSDICNHYPNRLVLVEAIKAVSNNRLRIIEEMIFVEEYDNPSQAWEGYKLHHKGNPEREFYVVHTSKPEIEVIEDFFSGIRRL